MSMDFDVDKIKKANLQRLMDKHGMSGVGLGAAIGVSQSYISNLLADPSLDRARNIGKGTMAKLCKFFKVDESEFHDPSVLVDDADKVQVPDRRYGPINVISWVSAGLFTEPVDEWPPGVSPEGDPVFSKKKCGPNTFALVVEGDSMEPRFFAGDIIVVDPSLMPQTGDYCIARLKGEVTFKKYYENGDEIRLIPLNETWEISTIPKGRKVDFKPIGKVVDMIPKL